MRSSCRREGVPRCALTRMRAAALERSGCGDNHLALASRDLVGLGAVLKPFVASLYTCTLHVHVHVHVQLDSASLAV